MDITSALTFLVESGTNPMSGVGLDTYKIPPSYKGDFVQDLYEAFLATDVVDPFNKVPLINHRNPLKSQWMPVENLDMRRHIKRHVLPKPGGTAEIMDLVDLLLSQPLDRSAPLWECHLVSGLKGKRFAVLTKSHHAFLDGTSAMARVIGSKSTSPKEKTVRGLWSELPSIHKGEANEAGVNNGSKSRMELARKLYEQSIKDTRQYADLVSHIVRDVGVSRFIRENYLPSAPCQLPYNAKGDIGKSAAAVSLSLDMMKKIAKQNSATVNDVFLATVSGGLYAYLKKTGYAPSSNLIAQVPMSLREPGDVEAGNKISMLFINLGDADNTNKGRLISIREDTTQKKAIARKADKRSLMAYSAMATGLGAVTSMFPESNQAANVLVSNVPGSRAKLYLMGAEMEATYALNVLPPGLSLIIVGFSYGSSMDIGLVAHRSALPDIGIVADAMRSSFRQLSKGVE